MQQAPVPVTAWLRVYNGGQVGSGFHSDLIEDIVHGRDSAGSRLFGRAIRALWYRTLWYRTLWYGGGEECRTRRTSSATPFETGVALAGHDRWTTRVALRSTPL